MIPIRDENPTRSPAVVVITIVVACTVIFLWQLSLPATAQERAIFALGFVPAHLFAPALAERGTLFHAVATLFTSMFLHGGLMHLLGNMLYLWIFGNNVEDAMGHGRFVIFYLLCGVAAAASQTLPNPHSEAPMIGASGAISGVLGAYLLLYPRARVLVVIPLGFYLQTIYLPAAAVLGFWLLLQVISSLMTSAGEGGVAWFAHMGGFIAGAALTPLFRRSPCRG